MSWVTLAVDALIELADLIKNSIVMSEQQALARLIEINNGTADKLLAMSAAIAAAEKEGDAIGQRRLDAAAEKFGFDEEKTKP